ncbi:MAG: DUF4336 domain-containing protein [Candidatus Elarobacter sp.]
METTRFGLQPFGDAIWTADGPDVRFMFAMLPTRMIVVKLDDGSLWIDSPVAVPAETIEHIRSIGPVKYLVAPTSLHAWRLERWHDIFPGAQLVGPPELARNTGLAASASLVGDSPPPAWADDLDQVVFKGNAFVEEAEFLHKRSRTLIMTDFIQNYQPKDGDVIGNVAKWFGGVLNGGVPVDIRLSFTDKKVARECLAKLLSWDFDKLIVAHGLCVERNAKPFVERSFRWLSG